MKNNILYLLLLAVILINSCSDQYLKDRGPELVETSSDTIFLAVKSNMDTIVHLKANSNLNANFEVYQYPKYLLPKTMSGKFVQGSTTLELTTLSDIFYYSEVEQLKAQLILNIEGYGLVTYPVMIQKLEDPRRIDFSGININIGEADSVVLTLTNNTESLANWSLYDLPDWLMVQTTSGILQKDESESLVFTVNRNYKTAGKYTGSVHFSIFGQISYVQDVSFSMDVIDIFDDPEKYNLKLIEGTVVDVHYFNHNNQLLVLTSSPNKLTLINFGDGNQSAVELSKKPFRMAVSENGNEVMVASTFAAMTHIDLAKLKVIKEYELPFVPFDIEFGENGWCYVASNDYNFRSNLASIHLASGKVIHKENENWMPEKALLMKIPHQEKVLVIPTFHSPSRPRIADFSTDSLLSDVYEFTYIDAFYNMWFVNDGKYGISRSKEIYKFNFDLPVENQMVLYGKLPKIHQWKDINFVSEDSLSKQVAVCYFDHTYENNSSFVSILESEGLNERAVIYPTTLINKGQSVRYAFITSKENKLIILIHAREKYVEEEGTWYIEEKAFD